MAQASDLTNPGRLANHQRLRREAAWAISQAEVAVARGTDPERAFQNLRAFFQDCIAEVNAVAPFYEISSAISPASIVANNTATATFSGTMLKNGSAAGSETVTFTLSGPQAATCTLSAATATTNGSGAYSVTVKGSVAGSVTVTASCHGKATSKTLALTAA